MGHVFISYNSEDRSQVVRLANELRSRGIEVWLDLDMDQGSRWREGIETAIKTAELTLACVGKHGGGPWQSQEIKLAKERSLDLRLVCLPGWTREQGRLGLDDLVADSLHEEWDLGVEILTIALQFRAPIDRKPDLAPPALDPILQGGPYPGIGRAFTTKDAPWFYGRERQTAKLTRRLRRNRSIILLGESGTGKSSVARAGVMNWWHSQGDGTGIAAAFEPSEKGTEDLAGALARACAEAGHHMDHTPPCDDPSAWSATLRTRFGGDKQPRPMLIVIDQAEQLFDGERLRGTNAEALSVLSALMEDRGLGVNLCLLAVLRVDRLQTAFRNEQFAALFKDAPSHFHLSMMEKQELEDAIVVPARRAGGGVEGYVVDTLVHELRGRNLSLPMLQFLLANAWETRGAETTIRRTQLGTSGFDRAIDEYIQSKCADDDRLTDERRLDALVLAFVDFGPDKTPRRRWITEKEVRRRPDHEQLERDIRFLEDVRLVVSRTADEETPAGASRWRLAHDIVLTSWKDLAARIEQRKETLELMADLRRHAAQGFLHRKLLQRFRGLLSDETLPEELRTFLAEADSHERRAIRTIVGVSGFGVLATVLLLWGWLAREERLVGREHARLLVTAAQLAAEEEPAVQRALLAQIPDDSSDLLIAHACTIGIAGVTRPPMIHDDPVALSRWSPAEDRILTVTVNGHAALWDIGTSRTEVVSQAIGDNVIVAEWSPGGTRILLGLDDGSVMIWADDDPQGSRRIVVHGAAVTSVAWNRNETSALTASKDGTASRWNTQSGVAEATFRGHTDGVTTISWSHDEGWVLTTSWDGTARVWNAETGLEAVPPYGHAGAVVTGHWDPDDGRILTASEDGTAQIWRSDDGSTVGVLGHDEPLVAAAWNPDGSAVVTVTEAGSTRLWNEGDGYGASTPLAEGERVLSAGWSPDGHQILTTARRGVSRLWTADGRALGMVQRNETWSSMPGRWNPEGSLVLLSSDGTTIRACDLDSTELLARIRSSDLAKLTRNTWRQWMGDDEHRPSESDTPRTAAIDPGPRCESSSSCFDLWLTCEGLYVCTASGPVGCVRGHCLSDAP